MVSSKKKFVGIECSTFEMIEEFVVEKLLMDIQEKLNNGKYQPLLVKKVYIPKPDETQQLFRMPIVVDKDLENYLTL